MIHLFKLLVFSLVGCSPWDREESNTTEQVHFHFSLSCIGEGNGNPLQCSCLENPRDGRAWWAAVCGVAQSWTQLKRLSSSSAKYNIALKLPSSPPNSQIKTNLQNKSGQLTIYAPLKWTEEPGGLQSMGSERVRHD